MCKLCNTDSSPSKPKYSKYFDNLEIVKQYIGTYPCVKCTNLIRIWHRSIKDSTQIDQYILFKLFRIYALANFTKEQLAKRKSNQAMRGHQSQSVLPGIKQIINKSTGNVSYLVQHSIGPDKKINMGTYPTLTEALEVKINHMQQNGCKRGLTLLSNKLKELTNGTI